MRTVAAKKMSDIEWEMDGEVAMNVRNSVRQEDGHYAESSSRGLCKTVIRHVLMHESETWARRKLARVNIIENVEMNDGNKDD